jgi:hypothetical protein
MPEVLLSNSTEHIILNIPKVYILMDGMYSDYHIVAVFQSEEDAEVYAAMHRRELECPEIREWEISTVQSSHPVVSTCWEIWVCQDGTVTNRISSYAFGTVGTVTLRDRYAGEYRVTFTVPKGTTIEQVDKIARDRLAKYRYEQLEQEMLALKQQMTEKPE